MVVLIVSVFNLVILKWKFRISFLEADTVVGLLVLCPALCSLWKA